MSTLPAGMIRKYFPIWIAFVVRLNYISGDDSFMCCMAGWKSVRGVVLCPRPCCEGYVSVTQTLPALGQVTSCQLKSTSTEAPPAAPTKPKVQPVTPAPLPVDVPILSWESSESDVPRSRIPPPARQRPRNQRVRPLSAAFQAALEGDESGAKRSKNVLFPLPANNMHHSRYAGRLLIPANPQLSEPAPTQLCSCKRDLGDL